jgi:hypothetical protein
VRFAGVIVAYRPSTQSSSQRREIETLLRVLDEISQAQPLPVDCGPRGRRLLPVTVKVAHVGPVAAEVLEIFLRGDDREPRSKAWRNPLAVRECCLHPRLSGYGEPQPTVEIPDLPAFSSSREDDVVIPKNGIELVACLLLPAGDLVLSTRDHENEAIVRRVSPAAFQGPTFSGITGTQGPTR